MFESMWAPQVITSSTPQLLIFVSNLDISACHAHETKKITVPQKAHWIAPREENWFSAKRQKWWNDGNEWLNGVYKKGNNASVFL